MANSCKKLCCDENSEFVILSLSIDLFLSKVKGPFYSAKSRHVKRDWVAFLKGISRVNLGTCVAKNLRASDIFRCYLKLNDHGSLNFEWTRQHTRVLDVTAGAFFSSISWQPLVIERFKNGAYTHHWNFSHEHMRKSERVIVMQ